MYSNAFYTLLHFLFCTCVKICLHVFHSFTVCEVIPMLLSSPEIRLELPLSRSSGSSTALKTSHLCQWLESVAAYYTTITSQALLCGKGEGVEGREGIELNFIMYV